MLKHAVMSLCLLLGALPVIASPLKVVTENLPPRQMKVDGKLTGFGVDVVRATLAEANLSPEIQLLPWARAYKMASERKNTLIFSIARTEKRESLFEWIGSIGNLNMHLYKMADRDDIVLNSLDDLPKYRTMAGINSALHEFLIQQNVPKKNIIHAETKNGLMMMQRGRIDLLLGDEINFPYQQKLKHKNVYSFKKMLPIPQMSVRLEMALSKGSDPSLVDKLRKALETIKQDGRYERIRAKYL